MASGPILGCHHKFINVFDNFLIAKVTFTLRFRIKKAHFRLFKTRSFDFIIPDLTY